MTGHSETTDRTKLWNQEFEDAEAEDVAMTLAWYDLTYDQAKSYYERALAARARNNKHRCRGQ